jgi:hypothetical protein
MKLVNRTNQETAAQSHSCMGYISLTNLVNLINVDNAVLGSLHVEVGRLHTQADRRHSGDIANLLSQVAVG